MTVQEKLGIKYSDPPFPRVIEREGVKLGQMAKVDASAYNAAPAIQWGEIVYINDGDASPFPFKVGLSKDGEPFREGEFSRKHLIEVADEATLSPGEQPDLFS